MTIKEAIDKIDNLSPNQYSEEIKVDWLSRLDYRIFNDIILRHLPPLPLPPKEIVAVSTATPLDQDVRHIPPKKSEFEEYSVDDMTKQLLAPFPYDELYIFYLQMKIDETNKETAQYNNSATLFNNYYENFAADYNRDHKPVNRARWNMWSRT